MHAYLATVCRDCGCEAYRVGGVADHVHIAARLARTISQADLLEKIKKTASSWIKTQGPDYGSFFWPLILIKSEPLRTLPIGMLFFDSNYGRQTNLIMAASVMNILPLVLLFLVSQKFLVRGIQLGAVKG